MATLQELKDQIAQIGIDAAAEAAQEAARAQAAADQVTALTAEVQRLTDLLAAGTPVTQADLDALSASLTDLDTAVKGIVPDAPPA